jgi:hypothetical protein
MRDGINMVTALGALGVTEIFEDFTTKVSLNFGSVVSAYNATQDNIATIANNGVIGTYNVVDNAVVGTTTIVMDTEVRVVDAFNNLVDRWSTIIYDVIEIFTYIILFAVVITIITLMVFHDELFTVVDHLIIVMKKWADGFLKFSTIIP